VMGVRARPMAWWELASVSRADRITEGAAKATGARRAYAEACITSRTLLSNGDAASAIATLEPVVSESIAAIDAHHLFEANMTRIAIRRGAHLRKYAYAFIELFAPHLTRDGMEKAIGTPGESYEI